MLEEWESRADYSPLLQPLKDIPLDVSRSDLKNPEFLDDIGKSVLAPHSTSGPHSATSDSYSINEHGMVVPNSNKNPVDVSKIKDAGISTNDSTNFDKDFFDNNNNNNINQINLSSWDFSSHNPDSQQSLSKSLIEENEENQLSAPPHSTMSTIFERAMAQLPYGINSADFPSSLDSASKDIDSSVFEYPEGFDIQSGHEEMRNAPNSILLKQERFNQMVKLDPSLNTPNYLEGRVTHFFPRSGEESDGRQTEKCAIFCMRSCLEEVPLICI